MLKKLYIKSRKTYTIIYQGYLIVYINKEVTKYIYFFSNYFPQLNEKLYKYMLDYGEQRFFKMQEK